MLLTPEEEIILKRLSPPPKCMHGDFLSKPDVTEMETYWKCNRCGLIAQKRIPGFIK